MMRLTAGLSLILLIGTGAQAATTQTTLTVNATGALSGTSIAVNGTASLTNIGSGTFTANAGLTSLDSSGNASVNFTIALSGGNLTGTIKVPASVLAGAGSGSGSATITGGTGTYAGATGSFPSISGTATGSIVSSLTLTFSGTGSITTGSGSGGPPTANGPTITAVLDAGAYTKNIAQGSIFVVKGTNLSASGFTQLSFPLPATSGGVKITFTPTSGGAGTDAYLVYLYNQNGVNQLAAVLPSTVATGNYNVTVTNNGAVSAGFPVTVVKSKVGLITRNSGGTGLAVLQNFTSATAFTIDAFTTAVAGTGPVKPGAYLVAWATGMGPVTGGDNVASPGFDFSANGVDVQVIVGGVSIKPQYAGRAPGLAGADQINFVLPANVPTGCNVSLQVSVAGQLSNPTSISIVPDDSTSVCVAPGFTASQLQQYDSGKTFTFGNFLISQISETLPGVVGNVKVDSASGGFTKVSGFELDALARYQAAPTGACQVVHISGSQSQVGAVAAASNLDAGTITLTGPAGSSLNAVALTKDAATNAYSLSLGVEGLGGSLPGGINATLVAGTYSLAGAGGTDVGKFNASVTLGSPLNITGGLPATVVRSSGLRLAWTGGNSTDVVSIFGFAGQTTGTGANATVDGTAFTCITTAGQGGITIGSDILNQLPAAAGGLSGNSFGLLQVTSTVNPTSGNGQFLAPLTAGGNIDSGAFLGAIGVGSFPAYQ